MFSIPPTLKHLSTQELNCRPTIEICVTQKQPVDEFHPTVQELVEAGYSLEKCIEAVECHQGLEGAMDYLLSLDKEGGIFQTSLADERQHQYGSETEEKSQQEKAL